MLEQIFNHYKGQIKDRQREIVRPSMQATVAELLYYTSHIELHIDFTDGTHDVKIVAAGCMAEPGTVHQRLEAYTGLKLIPLTIMNGGAEEYEEILRAQDAMAQTSP